MPIPTRPLCCDTARGCRIPLRGAAVRPCVPLRALDPGSDVQAETRVWHESSDAFWGVLGSPATSNTSTRVALIPGGREQRYSTAIPPRHAARVSPPIRAASAYATTTASNPTPGGHRSRRDPLPRWRTERVRYMPSSRCLIRVIPQLRHALTLRLCDLPHHDHGDLPLIARYSFDQKGVCDTSKRAGRRCADTVQTEDPKLGREAARQDAPWVVDPHSY